MNDKTKESSGLHENKPPIEKTEGAAPRRQIQGNSVVLDAWRKSREAAKSASDEPQEFTLQRDDNRPIRFKGYLIGWNEVSPGVPRGTLVQVYVTRSSGKIVTSLYQWQRKDELERERYRAEVHETPSEAFQWLVDTNGGRLGQYGREAWNRACRTWPSLNGEDVEVID